MWVAFPGLINILFVLSIVIAIVGAIAAGFVWGGFSLWRLLVSLVLGVSGVILLFGTIYLMLDIRDSFRKKKGYLSSLAALRRAKEQSSRNSEIISDEAPETRFSVQSRAVYEQGRAKKDAVLGMYRQHVLPLLASWQVKLTAWWEQKRLARQDKKATDAASARPVPARVQPAPGTSKVEAQPEHKPARKAVQPAVVVSEAATLPDSKPAGKGKLVLAILAVLIVIIGVVVMLMVRKSENPVKPEVVRQEPVQKASPKTAPAARAEEKVSPAPAKNAEKPKQPASQGKKQRTPATNTDAQSSSKKPAENKTAPKKDQPKSVFDLIKKIPKGEAPKSDPWD